MKALLALSLVGALAVWPARAEGPELRANVSVARDVVTLGDLVENAGPAATAVLFQAPELGSFGTIQAWRVVDAAKSYGLGNLDTHGIAEVRVERPGRVVTPAEMADVVAQEMMRVAGTADRSRVIVTIDPSIVTRQLDAPPKAQLTVERFTPDVASGRFDAILTAVDGTTRSTGLRIMGTAVEQIDAVRLRRTVARGEVITASDVVIERIARNRMPSDTAVTTNETIGLAARRALTEGVFLRSSDLERPRVIARGDNVTIVFESDVLIVTAKGRAMDAGAVGDAIDVQNTTSKRIVQAIVAGPGKVLVRLTNTRRLAEAAIPPNVPSTTP